MVQIHAPLSFHRQRELSPEGREWTRLRTGGSGEALAVYSLTVIFVVAELL